MSTLAFAPFHSSNFLLSSLPLSSLQRLQPHLQYSAMRCGEVIYRAGEHIKRCYFPERGLVSFFISQADRSVGLGMVGREGMVGAPNLLSETPSANEAIASVAGAGHWIDADVLRQESAQSSEVQTLLLQEVKNGHLRTTRVALCQARHTTLEQMSVTLLRLRHEAASNHILLPNALLLQLDSGDALHHREALNDLARAGIIRCESGAVAVLDMSALEASACSCYHASMEMRRRFRHLQSEYERKKHEFERLQNLWEGRTHRKPQD